MSRQFDLFAEEDCTSSDELATRKVACQHGVQVTLTLHEGLEVCDLTSCPFCLMLPEQSSPARLRHVLMDSGEGVLLDTIEEYRSYGGSI